MQGYPVRRVLLPFDVRTLKVDSSEGVWERPYADVVEFGRHAVLRGQWLVPCRFDSGHRQELGSEIRYDRVVEVKFSPLKFSTINAVIKYSI